MQTSCPHCSQLLELDPETLDALRAMSRFECPACAGQIPVAPIFEHRGMAPLANPRAEFEATQVVPLKRAQPVPPPSHRSMNRNLLILGSFALLVLGGLAAFIASRKEGNVFKTKQDISNEIIRNKFFTDLIASGATTAKDLEAVTGLRQFGDGFVGISRDKVTWSEAQTLAVNTGSEILEMADGHGSPRSALAGELSTAFPELLGSTVWVREGGTPGMIDCPDVLAVTTLERRRHVFVHWLPNNPYLRNRNWMRLAGTEPELPHTFDADRREWLHLRIQYNNTGPKSLRISAKPYFEGKAAEGYGNNGLFALEPGSGEVSRGCLLTRAGEIDEVWIHTWAADGPTKDSDIISTTRIPVSAVWKSSQDIELIYTKPPSALTPQKEITIPAKAGQRFTVGLIVRYNTPRPTKLASNLLLKEANILPQEFLAELQANHSATWHFDTESRPGYGSVSGRGTVSYDLTGYAPSEPGTYTFNLNLGLFDKNTWATQVMKLHKVTLNVSTP